MLTIILTVVELRLAEREGTNSHHPLLLHKLAGMAGTNGNVLREIAPALTRPVNPLLGHVVEGVGNSHGGTAVQEWQKDVISCYSVNIFRLQQDD